MTKFFHIFLTISLLVGTAFADCEKRKGAPNQIGKGETQTPSRTTIRKPLNLEKGNGRTKKDGEDANKPESDPHGIKPGMQRKPLTEVLGLNGENTEAFQAALKAYHGAVKAIHTDKEMDAETKKAAVKKAHEAKMEALTEILDEKQLAQLRSIWRLNAKPKHKVDLVKHLKLTEEQTQKLKAARLHAIKRKQTIIGNKELSKEEMKKALAEATEQFLKRRREILTDTQLAKLQELREKFEAARKNKDEEAGKQSSGAPKPRFALGHKGEAKGTHATKKGKSSVDKE